MPVTDEDGQGAISGSRKEPLYDSGVGRDSRAALQPLEPVGPPSGKLWIAEERCREKHVAIVLDENSRDAEVGDRNGLAGINTISWRAADRMRRGDDLVPHNIWASAAGHHHGCRRQGAELEPRAASHQLRG